MSVFKYNQFKQFNINDFNIQNNYGVEIKIFSINWNELFSDSNRNFLLGFPPVAPNSVQKLIFFYSDEKFPSEVINQEYGEIGTSNSILSKVKSAIQKAVTKIGFKFHSREYWKSQSQSQSNYQFNFTLLQQNEDEQKINMEVVNVLRNSVLPVTTTNYLIDILKMATSSTVQLPSIFEFSVKIGNVIYLPLQGLTNINATYSRLSFANGLPVQIDLSLSFKRLIPQYNYVSLTGKQDLNSVYSKYKSNILSNNSQLQVGSSVIKWYDFNGTD